MEFLGKSNGKKWPYIWKLLLIKGVKLQRIYFFFLFFFDKLRLKYSLIIKSILQGSGGYTARIRRFYNKDYEVIQQGYTTRIMRLLAGIFVISVNIRIGWDMLCLPYAGFFSSSWSPEMLLLQLAKKLNKPPILKKLKCKVSSLESGISL